MGGWKQRKRYLQEPENIKPVRIQPRDIDIFAALDRYRYLKTEHLLRLFAPKGKSEKAIRRRLMYLFHNGYVNRRLLEDGRETGFGSSQAIYILDRAGALELKDAGRLSSGMDVIRRRARPGQRELEHTLSIATFQLLLDLALDTEPSLELRSFISDRERRDHIVKVRTRRYRVKMNRRTNTHDVEAFGGQITRTLWPDASFLIERLRRGRPAEQYLYFLEIDRAARNHQRLFDRALAYQQYTTVHNARLMKRRALDTSRPTKVFVLFVAPDVRRLQSLITVSNAVPEVRRNRPAFWFLSSETFDLEHPQRLLSEKLALNLSSTAGFLIAP